MLENTMNTMNFQRMIGSSIHEMNGSVSGKVQKVEPRMINNSGCMSSNTSHPDNDMNNMFTNFAFPFKLHSILENARKAEQDTVISWLPSGKAFKIHKPKEFADVIMPQYFNQTKYRSFQRQLYIYGFDRVKDKSSDDYGAYFHELFIRGESDLCLDMQRKKIKGTGLSNEERRRRSQSKPAASCTYESSMESATPLQSVLSRFPTANESSMRFERDNSKVMCSQSVETPFGPASLPTHVKDQTPRRVSYTEEWSNEKASTVIKSAMQVQEIATRQNFFKNINISNIGQVTSIPPQLDKFVKTAGRRCSLGFIRGTQMGRRGSLLFDGDVVCFGDRQFHFTSEY